MSTVEPTMMLALKVWWAWLWRVMPLAFIAGFLIGLAWGFIGLATGAPAAIGALLGALVGFYISIYIFYRLMTKGFGPYRLVVTEKERDAE
ncbi:MAG: hypothetical protein LRZ85_08490 [Alphaproteobacteria bacterium]|nr:hypothetical protein [Alphaproteobacteria bacterium]MCD8570120.1 hypothetical protein [Alphaproteobacteria bacterium]